MEKQVFNYMRKYNMVKEGDFVVAGVSGGADSMCLLHILMKYQHYVPFDLLVVHVNHGIRGAEAKRDEDFVRDFCIKRGIEFKSFNVDVPSLAKSWNVSLEEAGRKARYDIFVKECAAEEQGVQAMRCRVAVAHHANDQAETVLFHLVRGSGIKGAAGMLPVNDMIIRPLLDVTRVQIEEYLTKEGIDFVTDSTNLDNDYSRNRLRNTVIPYLETNLNEGAVANIVSFAEIMGDTWQYLSMSAGEAFLKHVQMFESVAWIKDSFAGLPKILKNMILMQVFEKLTGTMKDIGSVHVAAVMGLFAETGKGQVSLPYSLKAQKGYKGVYVYGDNVDIYDIPEILCAESGNPVLDCADRIQMEEIEWDKSIKIPLNDYTKYFDCDRMKGNVCIRHRQTGDYIIISEDGRKKSIKDFFIDCKIPRKLRDRVVLVADGNHILWVVGYRDTAGCRIDTGTRRVLKVWLSERKDDESDV